MDASECDHGGLSIGTRPLVALSPDPTNSGHDFWWSIVTRSCHCYHQVLFSIPTLASWLATSVPSKAVLPSIEQSPECFGHVGGGQSGVGIFVDHSDDLVWLFMVESPNMAKLLRLGKRRRCGQRLVVEDARSDSFRDVVLAAIYSAKCNHEA